MTSQVSPAANSLDTADNLDVWIAFEDAYAAFVLAKPQLGLGSNTWACTNLRRNFGALLVQRGAAVKLVNRRWLAHRDKFGPALFELLTRTPAQVVKDLQELREVQS
jgi:hypothetical protein